MYAEYPSSTAMIIVDHGSRRAQANQLLHTIAQQLQETSGSRFLTVQPAHMELAEPSLETAFSKCLIQGATEIVVSLFFLSPGRHATSDIPDMIAEIQKRYPGLRIVVTDPLAPDPRLNHLLLHRAEEALLEKE